MKLETRMRLNLRWMLGLLAAVLVTPAVTHADTMNFISCPSGDSCPGALGNTATYTMGGMSVTATGYSAPGTETALFNKQEGGDETGLGLAAMSDNEVGPGNFIQLDLNQLANGGTTNGWLTLGSVQPGEGFMVCDSSTAGSMAGATCFTSGLDGQPVAISWSSGAPFIDITATTGNVLLDGLTLASAVTGGIDTPEPGTTMLLLLGAPALLFAARRRLARIAS